jgi:mono/diheme cytochrome c family protein
MILWRGIGFACLAAMLSACTETASFGEDPRADPRNAANVVLGKKLYQKHCAACHGANLEGQPNWRERLPNGKLPAPPHDDSGHTWHHPDEVLFAITKNGLVWPQAPKSYESDMPAFAEKLSDDEIWAVLAYIKSHWTSTDVLKARKEMTRNVRSK